MSIFDRLRALLGGADETARGGAADEAGEAESASPMITCAEALQTVHDFLDGEFRGASRAQVQRHFEVCQRCYPHLKFEAAFKDALRRAGAGCETPEGLKEKVTALLDEAQSEG